MITAAPSAACPARPGRRSARGVAASAALATALVVLGVALTSPASAAPRADGAAPATAARSDAPGSPAEVEEPPADGVPEEGPAAPDRPGAGGGEAADAEDPAAAQARRELDAAIAAAQHELDARSAAASAALETYQDAVRARDEAVLAHERESERLAAARARERGADVDVARWTSQAYRHGVAGGDVAELGALVGAGGPQDLQLRMAGLRQVGRAESRDLLDARDARRSAQDAVRESAGTAAAASAAAEQAAAARQGADASVAALGEQVAALTTLRAQGGALPDGTVPAGAALPGSGAAPLTGCPPRDLRAYANGRVPLSALCPVPGAPGKVLRADAAAAFAAMSAAHAADHGGQGLCVTDAYRDLASQVAVRAARPSLAAVPGTSKHGWGVAVDLCGGVADPSSEASAWLRAHAGLYGWFHPAWAQTGGALPEAWHWEFAG